MEHKAGDTIIQQGDEGDNFYVVSSGVCKVFVGSRDETGLVMTCATGDSFGELALMYNVPRAATVMAETNLSLWALDRGSFLSLVMKTAVDKRGKYGESAQAFPGHPCPLPASHCCQCLVCVKTLCL